MKSCRDFYTTEYQQNGTQQEDMDKRETSSVALPGPLIHFLCGIVTQQELMRLAVLLPVCLVDYSAYTV